MKKYNTSNINIYFLFLETILGVIGLCLLLAKTCIFFITWKAIGRDEDNIDVSWVNIILLIN